MSLPNNIFITAFRQQRLGLMLATIITILVYLATMAAMGETFLSHAAMTWGEGQRGHLTLEIPPPETAAPQTERVKQVITILKSMPEIALVKEVTAAETERLLEPWLKDSSLVSTLPLPTLIDIQFRQGMSIDPKTLSNKLKNLVPDLNIDDSASWLGEILNLTQGLGMIAMIMVLLTGILLVIAIAVICRATMSVQHETIELLHLLGAADQEIARQFQNRIWRLSWPAAAIGFSLALLTLIALALILERFASWILIFNPSSFIGSAMIIFVPLLAVTCATFTARHAVLKRLQQIL